MASVGTKFGAHESSALSPPILDDDVLSAAWTGLRQGEILGLQWEDIDFTSRFVEIRRTVGYRGGRLLAGSPKSGRARRVDLASPLAACPEPRPPRLAPSTREGGAAQDPLPRSAAHIRLVADPAGRVARLRERAARSLVDPDHGGPVRHLVPGANRSAVDRLAETTGRNLTATDEGARGKDRDVIPEEDWSRRRDLNPRPADYESAALPLSYTGAECSR
jgi:integrase